MEEWKVNVTWTRHPEDPGQWVVDANNAEEALKQALLEVQGSGAWTVIGFWYNDYPVVAGVIRGDHGVTGGNVNEHVAHAQGEWAVSVSASDADDAGEQAVEEMLSTLGSSYTDDDPDADYPFGDDAEGAG